MSYRFNNAFVHGIAAWSAYALTPFLHSSVCLVIACIICLYAGWHRQACLASFLGGITVGVVGWSTAGILGAPDVGLGALFMVPVALLVILPAALAGYLFGKAISMLASKRPQRPD